MIIEFDDSYPMHLRELTADAMDFYADLLMGERLKRSLCITIEGHHGLIEDYANALCSWDCDWTRPRDFEMTIRTDMEEEDLLRVLAHEMVHVKQWAREELKERYKPVHHMKWNGEIVDRDTTDYWDLPWEIEAHGREEGLTIRYLEHRAEQNNKAMKNILTYHLTPVSIFDIVNVTLEKET